MSADDHLNAHQWPLEKVGRLQSGNRPGMTVAEEYNAHTRGDYTEDNHEHARAYGYPDAEAYQNALTQHIVAHGIARTSYWGPGDESLGDDPNDKVLLNGFHRYKSARDLGHATMPLAQYPTQNSAKQDRVSGWNGAR